MKNYKYYIPRTVPRNRLVGWFGWFMVLNAIFQLYRGGQSYCWRKPEYPEKTPDLLQVTDNPKK